MFSQLANDDGTVTYDEIRNQLKKWEKSCKIKFKKKTKKVGQEL